MVVIIDGERYVKEEHDTFDPKRVADNEAEIKSESNRQLANELDDFSGNECLYINPFVKPVFKEAARRLRTCTCSPESGEKKGTSRRPLTAKEYGMILEKVSLKNWLKDPAEFTNAELADFVRIEPLEHVVGSQYTSGIDVISMIYREIASRLLENADYRAKEK